MRIAVYPGSFDPMHIGHLAILRHLSDEFDCSYLVVSPQNPFKDPGKAQNARQRVDAARAALARHPELRARVEDIELGMPAPHYTIRTLEALQAREPQNDFTLIIGEDNVADLPRWKSARKLLRNYDILVFPRNDSGCSNTDCSGNIVNASSRQTHDIPQCLRDWCRKGHLRCHIRFADAPLVDVSSTQLRAAIASGEDVSALLA